MVEVFDRQRRLTGILHNAFKIHEELKINNINYLNFSMPENDIKNELCLPFHFVKYDNGDFYRILPQSISYDEVGDITYKCEHVLAMLIDSSMYGHHVIGNIGTFTRNVLLWILDKQNKNFEPWNNRWVVDARKSVNWILGECDFSRQFEYGFSQETVLSALLSVPNRFVEPYMWTFNTDVFPFVISLKRLDKTINPQMYIRARKNMLKLVEEGDPSTIRTRIYPLGAGEGINQLDIRSVNNGVPFVQSPQSIINKYGLIELIWADRRYENPESLKEAAEVMLNELQEPYKQYEVDFALLGLDDFDVPELGKLVEIVDFTRAFITGIKFNYEEIKKSKLEIANRPRDIANTVADLANRQRIEMAYSQGATQFFAQNWYDNADPQNPLLMKVYIPSDLRIINYIVLDVEVMGFRMPFRVTGGGGRQTVAQSSTTSSGASSTATTSAGGGTFRATSRQEQRVESTTEEVQRILSSTQERQHDRTTAGGGGSTTDTGWNLLTDVTTLAANTTIAGGQNTAGHSHVATTTITPLAHQHKYGITVTIPAHPHDFTIPAHQHEVTIPRHQHNVTIPAHEHSVTIDAHEHGMSHTHNIAHTHDIPDHTHTLDPGIAFSGNPTSFQIRINGVVRRIVVGRTWQGRIDQWMLNPQGVLSRNTYHRIEIIPNEPAYCMQTVNFQGFMQSRGDSTL